MFIALLILYYRFFLLENLGRDFNVFKDHLYQTSEEVAAKLNQYYLEPAKLKGLLGEISEQKNVKITIYDVKGNKFVGVDRRKGYGLNLELKNFTVVRKTIYIVELIYPFAIENFAELNSFKKIRDVALVLLGLLITLLIIYLHFFLVRPLTALNRGLATIDYRNAGLAIPMEAGLRTRRNDELGDLTRRFVQMQQRLATSRRQQTEMIASISHDLKTPLTSIIGFVERLLGHTLAAERQAEYHRIIYQKAQDIKELVTEFNDYVTSDFSDVMIHKDTVNLQEFFTSICNEYLPELTGRGIDFEIQNEINTGADLWLDIDEQRIRRVFANLVGNTLKYAEELHKITFKCGISKNQARFAVEDDGPGVPSIELGAIFEKFYRVEKSRSREKGGSGLGLAICRNMIENHGGTIEAYRVQSGGLGIAFTLPLNNSNNRTS